IGTVPNVGLMAQAAEEYGSHDKTFEIAAAGRVEIIDGDGTVVIEHTVGAGDIWRATQTKHIPRSEEHTSELQSRENLVCRLLLVPRRPRSTLFPYTTLFRSDRDGSERGSDGAGG